MDTRQKSETPLAGGAVAKKNALEAVPIIALGAFPRKLDSACAAVLARLLAGEILTAADTLDCESTMRAAAHVHYLRESYGWPILSEPRANGCGDGRMVNVACYRLPQHTIAKARAEGAADWCADVRSARAARRANASKAKRRAAATNADSKRSGRLEQGDLFGEAMQ